MAKPVSAIIGAIPRRIRVYFHPQNNEKTNPKKKPEVAYIKEPIFSPHPLYIV